MISTVIKAVCNLRAENSTTLIMLLACLWLIGWHPSYYIYLIFTYCYLILPHRSAKLNNQPLSSCKASCYSNIALTHISNQHLNTSLVNKYEADILIITINAGISYLIIFPIITTSRLTSFSHVHAFAFWFN